jgi:P4 family phage/plasmid primase-like protien
MNQEYIYLIQEREFIKTNEEIYKIGRTKQNGIARFKQYPKGSILLIHTSCSDCIIIEKQLINLFKQLFIQRTDIGTEYFQGDYKIMKEYINNICAGENEYTLLKDNNISINNYGQVIDNNILELEKLYNNYDIGYIDIYYNKYQNDIVCISKKGKLFLLYDDSTQLWKTQTIEDIHLHFLTNIKILVQPLLNYYNREAIRLRYANLDKANEYAEKALKIKNTKEFAKLSTVKGLTSLILSKFYNQEIIKKIDTNESMLSVKNGVINLKTGEFRERTKEDYFSFELNTEWKGYNYETPDINNFFNDIMLNNNDMVNYLQKILGYSISKYTNNHDGLISIFWGNDYNGKTILQNLLKTLMGNYYKQVSNVISINTKYNNGNIPSTQIIELSQTRIVFSNENNEYEMLDERTIKSIIKKLSTPILPEFINPILSNRSCQLFLLTNQKTEVITEHSIGRKLISIPFLSESTSKDIEANLLQKLDQLLVWLVIGAVKYFKEKLNVPPNMINIDTRQYSRDNNDFNIFLDKICIKNFNGFVYHCDLMTKYKSEYDNNITPKGFTNIMKGKGYIPYRKKDGMGFKGIQLK